MNNSQGTLVKLLSGEADSGCCGKLRLGPHTFQTFQLLSLVNDFLSFGKANDYRYSETAFFLALETPSYHCETAGASLVQLKSRGFCSDPKSYSTTLFSTNITKSSLISVPPSERKIVWPNLSGKTPGTNSSCVRVQIANPHLKIHEIIIFHDIWLYIGRILTNIIDGFHSCLHQLSFRHGASSSGSLWACLEWFTKIWRNSSSLVSFSSPAQV